MLKATEFCLSCTTVVAVAQNKLRVSQLQAVSPGLFTENIPHTFSSSQLCTSGAADTPCSSLTCPLQGTSSWLQLLYKGVQPHITSATFQPCACHISPPTLHLRMLRLLRCLLFLLMLWHFSGNVRSVQFLKLEATRLMLSTMMETACFWLEDIEL